MAKLGKGIYGIMSAEEAEFEQEEVGTPVEDIVDTTEVETELMDSADETSDIEDMDSELENAEDAVEAQEALIDALERAVQSGGLDRYGAEMYHIAQSSIQARLGLEPEALSLEAFDEYGSRSSATVRSLEEEKGKFRQYLDKIIAFLKRMAEQVVTFIKKIVTARGAVERRIAKVETALKSKPDLKGVLTDSQASKYGAKLSTASGGVAKSVLSASETLKTGFNDFVGKYAKIVSVVEDKTKDFEKGRNIPGWDAFKQLIGASTANDARATIQKNIHDSMVAKLGAGKTKIEGYSVVEELLDNYVIGYQNEEGKDFTIKLFKAPAKNKDAKLDSSALPKKNSEASKILGNAKIIAAQVENLDKAISGRQFLKQLKTDVKSDDAEVQKALTAFVQSLSPVVRSVYSVAASTANNAIASAKVLLDLVIIAMGSAPKEKEKK